MRTVIATPKPATFNEWVGELFEKPDTRLINFVDKLADFENQATPSLFVEVFGHVGKHLFSKFSNTHKMSVIKMWKALDLENQAKLVKFINS